MEHNIFSIKIRKMSLKKNYNSLRSMSTTNNKRQKFENYS